MVRSFVAFEISSEMRERLSEAQKILAHTSSQLRCVAPDQIHITVKFLGELSEGLIEKVKTRLSSRRFTPFTISACEIVSDNRHNPRRLWSRIEDNGESREIARIIDQDLAEYGLHRESRPYLPHATVARVSEAHPSLPTVLSGLQPHYGTCTITGLVLKKSTLSRRGPVYEDLLVVSW